MKKIILMLGIVMILVISGCNEVDNSFSEEELQSIQDYHKCMDSMEEIERIEFDLIVDYNLSCEKINFILLSWDSEIIREVEDYGLFINTYKDVDYGVHKSIRLEREIIKYEPSLSNCSTTSRITTSIYLKEHFINYFMENCL